MSNLEYPYAFVRTVSLLEGQERTFSVVAVQSNVFTSTTCDAALRAIAECEGCRVVHQARYDLAPPFLLYPPPAIEPFTRVAQAVRLCFVPIVCALPHQKYTEIYTKRTNLFYLSPSARDPYDCVACEVRDCALIYCCVCRFNKLLCADSVDLHL